MDIRSTRIFKLWEQYEHHLGVGALAIGFLFDLWIAKRPDSIADNILLLSYLFVAGAFIIFLNLRRTRQMEIDNPVEPLFLLLVVQFCFGGLASNLLVLYGKSGTFTASAIFIGLLAALVMGNEYLRSRYAILRFNIVIYYVLLLTYCIISVPIFIFHSIGPWVFLMSGLISLIVIGIFMTVLFFTVLRGNRARQGKELTVLIALVFLFFNGLYFFDFIPPVPLSLKSVGVYHSILKRSSGDYVAMYEKPEWYAFWRDTSASYSYTPGKVAYCFSSVFAPTDLSAPIYHEWEYYNEQTKGWESKLKVQFPISGGRDEGYRGFSTATVLQEGRWRCDVETTQGATIGRISFTVKKQALPALSQTIL